MLENIKVLGSSSYKISDIENIAKNLNDDELDNFINRFSNDNRKSVQKICQRTINKRDRLKEEYMRLDAINKYEEEAYTNGYTYIGGVDEAGRGPLVGPVVAAVVVFDRMTKIKYIDDSKKISESRRNELFDIIINNAKDYGIGIADNKEIDEYNILNATYIAMKRAISNLKKSPDCLLNDAVKIPDLNIYQVPIIKGDSKSISIAAASILAKVTRDRIMYEYDQKYPGYSFSSNKGYGTKEHYEGLKKYGKTDIHRNSFLKGVL